MSELKNFVCFYSRYLDRNTWINLDQVQTVHISEVPAGYSVEITLNGGVSSKDATAATVSSLFKTQEEAEESIEKLINGVNYWEEKCLKY